MPKKLTRCVQHLKDKGYPEDSAWPICVESTGLKPHKKSLEFEIEEAWNEFKKGDDEDIDSYQYYQRAREDREDVAAQKEQADLIAARKKKKTSREFDEQIDKCWNDYKKKKLIEDSIPEEKSKSEEK